MWNKNALLFRSQVALKENVWELTGLVAEKVYIPFPFIFSLSLFISSRSGIFLACSKIYEIVSCKYSLSKLLQRNASVLYCYYSYKYQQANNKVILYQLMKKHWAGDVMLEVNVGGTFKKIWVIKKASHIYLKCEEINRENTARIWGNLREETHIQFWVFSQNQKYSEAEIFQKQDNFLH